MLALSDIAQESGECHTNLDSIAFQTRLEWQECLSVLHILEESGHIAFIQNHGGHYKDCCLSLTICSIRAEYNARPVRQKTPYQRTIEEWNKMRGKVAPSIMLRDSYKCVYCGAVENLSIDHRTPVFLGGTNDLDNLATCCRSCNSSKGDRTVEDWTAAKEKRAV